MPICISNPSTVRRNGTAITPALFTRTSTFSVASAKARTDDRSERSNLRTTALGPMSAATASAFVVSRQGEDDVGPGFAQRSCDYLTQSTVRPRDDKCAAGLIDYVFCGPFGHAFQRTCLTRR